MTLKTDARVAGVTRREMLTTAAAAAAAMLAPRILKAAEAAGTPAASTREGFRFVHLTDIHVQPELKADQGLRKCLQVVHDLQPRPDFILTGGDLVFDISAQEEGRANQLFDLYTRICKDSDIPIRQCIGNHDIFGWGARDKVSPTHAKYGKKMVQERLDLPRTTYSFDHKGWHICVIDDVQPGEGKPSYYGGISQEDYDWLGKDLASAGAAPKIMCAHIPFVSVAVFRNTNATDQPDIRVPKNLICRNAGPILQLLRENNVNLVLTGHLHQNERIQYEKTTHIGEGAVCGGWWKGAHRGTPEGFGVIDCRPDGTFEHSYHTYGWQAVG